MTVSVIVEGGKTKTLCIVLNDHGVLGIARAGASGWTVVGKENAVRIVGSCINSAIARSGVNRSSIDIAVLSLSDIDTAKLEEYHYRGLRDLHVLPDTAEIHIMPDYVNAYYAVTMGKPGIVVIAGTGSMAYGRNSRGETGRGGGWGWFGDDEGSAIWISMKALEKVYRAIDGRGGMTTLANRVMGYFGVQDPLDLIEAVHETLQREPEKIAGLSRIVDEEARRGDEASREILGEAAANLFLMVKALYTRLFRSGEKITIGGTGSVFSSTIVREFFIKKILEEIPSVEITEFLVQHQPVKGLLVVLKEKLGYQDSYVERMLRSIAEALGEPR